MLISKIFLVENNEMNRDMLSRRLERKDFEVVMAVDGQAGVDMASSSNPDIILFLGHLYIFFAFYHSKLLFHDHWILQPCTPH